MNVQKIFEALTDDTDNSALGIICGELESQGYGIVMDGEEVTSSGFFEGIFPSLENKLGPVNVALFRNGVLDQEFSAEFVDFHDMVIKPKEVD